MELPSSYKVEEPSVIIDLLGDGSRLVVLWRRSLCWAIVRKLRSVPLAVSPGFVMGADMKGCCLKPWVEAEGEAGVSLS